MFACHGDFFSSVEKSGEAHAPAYEHQGFITDASRFSLGPLGGPGPQSGEWPIATPIATPNPLVNPQLPLFRERKEYSYYFCYSLKKWQLGIYMRVRSGNWGGNWGGNRPFATSGTAATHRRLRLAKFVGPLLSAPLGPPAPRTRLKESL